MGDYIFVVVDYFNRYFDIAVIEKVTSVKIIACFNMFATHGIPISIIWEPQFKRSEFKKYLRVVSGINLHNVTPLWPQANGEVERQNRTLLNV